MSGKYHVSPGESFVCQSCKCKPHLKDKQSMREHLQTVHQVDSMKGDKKLIMYSDGRGYSSSTHSWTVAGVEFVQHTICPR